MYPMVFIHLFLFTSFFKVLTLFYFSYIMYVPMFLDNSLAKTISKEQEDKEDGNIVTSSKDNERRFYFCFIYFFHVVGTILN